MALGLDTPYIAQLSAKAAAVKHAGFSWAAGYIFAHRSFKERLTFEDAQQLTAAGLYIVTIWESGTPTSREYFLGHSGQGDASQALAFAASAGQPQGTPIYFTADYDAPSGDMDLLSTYFTAAHAYLARHGYTCGVYGNGLLCAHLKALGVVDKTWLSGSTGWMGYSHWKPQADIVQTVMDTSCLGIACDYDQSAPSGGGGWVTS